MDKHRSAQIAADSIIRQYQLKRVTLDNLVNIVGDQGFQIIDFEPEITDYASKLISELELGQIARQRKAFVNQRADVKLLFVYASLSPDEKLCAIAHELGHIKCGHLKSGEVAPHEVGEEYEANEFVHYLLHPQLFTILRSWFSRNKTAVIIACCVLTVAMVSVPIFHHVALEKSYHGEYYVTENGEKYHIESCISIRGREGVRRLTEDEFISGIYTPCKICLPDE